MEFTLRRESPSYVWKYASYKQYARKYNLIVSETAQHIALPSMIEAFDLDKIPNSHDATAIYQQEVFSAVHANASILKTYLEGELGVVDDEITALRDFIQARLRSAIFSVPENEHVLQDALETLLIGRGLQKGQDYDREVGRVKISTKEVVPDFILAKLDLAIEVKYVNSPARARDVIDEINADIPAYSKQYRTLLFVVYDVGHIRDEVEFRTDLELQRGVSVILVKH